MHDLCTKQNRKMPLARSVQSASLEECALLVFDKSRERIKYLRHHLVVSERQDMTEDEAYSIDVDNIHEETLPKKVKEYLAREYSPAKFESQGSMGEDALPQNTQRPDCCKRRRVAPYD